MPSNWARAPLASRVSRCGWPRDLGSHRGAQAQILRFLLQARGPDEVVHRATAALGLLPQVAWAELDSGNPDGPATLSVELDVANTATGDLRGGPRRLQVGLAHPRDREAAAFVGRLLSLTAEIYPGRGQAAALRHRGPERRFIRA